MFNQYFLKNTIRVLSFDFDGCLANRSYLTSNDIIEANKPFLEKIKIDNKNFTAAITFIGSLRQSITNDILSIHLNKKKTGSCFPTIKKVSDFLDTSFDPFLLADIEGDLTAGSTFLHALSVLNDGNHYPVSLLQKSNIAHNKCDTDTSKLVILYAQIHKVANDNPKKIISFEFYDDKPKILLALKNFFNKNPNLIPENVILRLNLYNGNDSEQQTEITGTGNIDPKYRETVTAMINQAIAKKQYQNYKLEKHIDFPLVKKLVTLNYSAADSITVINAAASVEPRLLINRKTSKTFNMFSFFTLPDSESLNSTVNALQIAFDHSLNFNRPLA